MHIAPLEPPPPTMTIARVRELVQEMAKARDPVVCSFTQEQLTDLLAEIDRRATTPTAPVSPVDTYAAHRKACDVCRRGPGRCENGQRLYTAACVSLVDEARLIL